MQMKLLFATSLAIFGSAAPASAQIAVRMACYSDIQKLCPAEFKMRDQDKMRTCLRANLAKASDSCRSAVRAQIAAEKRD